MNFLDEAMKKQEIRGKIIDNMIEALNITNGNDVEFQLLKRQRELFKKTNKIIEKTVQQEVTKEQAKKAIFILKQFNKVIDDFMKEEEIESE